MRAGWLAGSCLGGLFIVVTGITPSAAQSVDTHCPPGLSPQFVLGNAEMKAALGDAMGQPVTCEFPDPNGTGDVQQATTAGLAFWRKSTNTPTFTNGAERWADTVSGLVYWTGDSIDPTGNAQPWPLQAQAPAQPPGPAAPARPPVAAPPPARAQPPATGGFDPRQYVTGGNRYNCADFASQAQAQAVLRAAPSDPNRLDADRDGIACESNPEPFDHTAVPRP